MRGMLSLRELKPDFYARMGEGLPSNEIEGWRRETVRAMIIQQIEFNGTRVRRNNEASIVISC